jgi:DNA adenine methylase
VTERAAEWRLPGSNLPIVNCELRIAIVNTLESASASGAAFPAAEPIKPVRPFLKWAGGKRQLLTQLRPFIPHAFARYVEPFLGSGALFFDLCSRGLLEERDVILADTNRDLIGTYGAVAADVESVIRELGSLADGHAAGRERHYYDVRDRRFNPERRHVRGNATGPASTYPASLAAMFVYLNRTGYNGLYRLNANGDFNVPAGRYAKPRVCDAENLRAVARELRRRRVQLRHGAFDATLAVCKAGDFVYLDPPYAPVSATANFTSYTADRFSDSDQRLLQNFVIELSNRCCLVVLSNSTAPTVTALYESDPAAKRAGLRVYRVPARRAINSDAAGRGRVEEYVITNVRLDGTLEAASPESQNATS